MRFLKFMGAFLICAWASSASAISITDFQATSDATNAYYKLSYMGAPTWERIYLDTDRNPQTGYRVGGIGAKFLAEIGYGHGNLYQYAGTGSSWNWTLVKTLTYTNANGVANITVARADLGSPSGIDLIGSLQDSISTVYSTKLSRVLPRDPLKQPFSSNSIWNMPIGSQAVYVSASLPTFAHIAWDPINNPDWERIVMKPKAPLTAINYSSAGWSGKNRCNPTDGTSAGLPLSVPIPTSYVVPSDSGNDGAAFLAADARTVIQLQPFARCVAGGPGTALIAQSKWFVDLYGGGINGAHGGSGLSTLGGTIRVGELRPGQIGMRHALKLDVPSPTLYHASTHADSYRWPALGSDSYWSNYGMLPGGSFNTNSAMKMGALLALPATIDINSMGLKTEAARQIAWTLQNYGAYIVDTYPGYGEGYAVDEGADGSFTAQFKADYGFAFGAYYQDKTDWAQDLIKINGALAVVNNNSPTSIGGGGTPRQPLATAIAP